MTNDIKELEIDFLLLAQKVKAKRTKKRWGFRRVGASAGVSHMAVKRLEAGKQIKKANAAALATWAGLTKQQISTGQTHLSLL